MINVIFEITINVFVPLLSKCCVSITVSKKNMDIINSLCRLCLEDGATLPIFESSKENKILTKLSLCLNEKLEDIDGYPKNICNTCNNTLDIVCNFIDKYKDTCRILENQLVQVKQEVVVLDGSDFSDNEYSEVEIEIDQIKNEDQTAAIAFSSEYIKPPKSESVKIKKENLDGSVTIKKVGSTKTKKLTNKIATSILEGEFLWSGKVWCLKNSKLPTPKSEKPNTQPKSEQRQKALSVKLPKTPKTKTVKLCDICGEVFKTHDTLVTHRRKHFKNPVKCSHCLRNFVSQYYLKRHIKRKHDSNKDFICPLCGTGFAFKGELKSHHRRVHEKDSIPKQKFECSICHKAYKCRKSVVVHERSVHTGQRPAMCSVCGTSFTHEDYLKEHMRLHTGETPFKCPICGRGYAQRCNMKSHLRIHRVSELDAVTLSKLRPNYLRLLKA